MVHTKFQDYVTAGSEEEDFLKVLAIWWSSWSCDQDHFYQQKNSPSQRGST